MILQHWNEQHRRIDGQRYGQQRFNGMDPSRNHRESQQYTEVDTEVL
ncbi:11613_t:CDS:1, partial [Rhizophagus irregularis]